MVFLFFLITCKSLRVIGMSQPNVWYLYDLPRNRSTYPYPGGGEGNLGRVPSSFRAQES